MKHVQIEVTADYNYKSDAVRRHVMIGDLLSILLECRRILHEKDNLVSIGLYRHYQWLGNVTRTQVVLGDRFQEQISLIVDNKAYSNYCIGL